MRNRCRLTLIVLAVSLIGCGPSSLNDAQDSVTTPDWATFGKGVTLEARTSIGDILANPEAFKDQIVAVEGQVVGVCAMMGCWVELESDSKQRLRIKVDDGVIVFPQEAQGSQAVAQGKVELLDFTPEEYLEKARHEAEEMDREFDPASIGDPPYREVRIFGSGALVAAAREAS